MWKPKTSRNSARNNARRKCNMEFAKDSRKYFSRRLVVFSHFDQPPCISLGHIGTMVESHNSFIERTCRTPRVILVLLAQKETDVLLKAMALTMAGPPPDDKIVCIVSRAE